MERDMTRLDEVQAHQSVGNAEVKKGVCTGDEEDDDAITLWGSWSYIKQRRSISEVRGAWSRGYRGQGSSPEEMTV